MKKLMLLALGAISALLVLPAFASANPPLHLSSNPGTVQITGGTSELTREEGGGSHGDSLTGSATFTSTTGGTMNLTFHGVESGGFLDCSNNGNPTSPAGQSGGTVVTTSLPFHLVTLDNGNPGVLVTSNNGHFATYHCQLIGQIKVNGNGILGEITTPKCGSKGKTATVDFNGAAGVQSPKVWTGTTYTLNSTTFEGPSNSAMDVLATIHLPTEPTLICT